MAYRVILKKKWKNFMGKEYPVGTILQTDGELGSELIRTKTAEKYEGEYPPKEKVKIKLNDLNK